MLSKMRLNEFSLSLHDTITWCYFRYGMRMDGFQFEASSGRKQVHGGPYGGYVAKVTDLGTGILIGFEGSQSSDINKPVPVFAIVSG